MRRGRFSFRLPRSVCLVFFLVRASLSLEVINRHLSVAAYPIYRNSYLSITRTNGRGVSLQNVRCSQCPAHCPIAVLQRA